VRVDVGLLVAACCATGCVARDPATAPALPQHVLIVTIDTLRADHLGCYGDEHIATPNVDRLAREGAIALEATVPAPITRPSHVSIFTGLYPAQHGIRDNISRALAPDIPTLIESGFPDFEAVAWIGFMAPGGTPRAIVDAYHAELVRILALPDVKQRLLDIQFEIVAGTPEQFGEYIRWETPRWAKVIKDTGAKAN